MLIFKANSNIFFANLKYKRDYLEAGENTHCVRKRFDRSIVQYQIAFIIQ